MSQSSEGYHYFHDKIGDGAPKPEHKPIAVGEASGGAPEEVAVSIDKFAFMDDDDVVKVYVTLEGDLEGATPESVEFVVKAAKFDPSCSMLLHVRGRQHLHRMFVSHLMHNVEPEQCKFKINASKGKLIVTLRKKEKVHWEQLRAKVCLPYRKGGAE